MAVTRNKKVCDPGDSECQKLQDFVNKRKKKIKYAKKIQKIEDLLLCCIYFGLYILTFILFVSFSTNALEHIDFDPPLYLPIELSHQAQLLEAVQRSRRSKAKSPKKTKKKVNFKNFVKKNKFKRDQLNIGDQLVFCTGILKRDYYTLL